MSTTISAFDHKAWDDAKLQDYEDFSECVEFCNQVDLGDCSEGEWYYIPDEPLKEGPYVGCRVIYSGSFGNYNAPGASSYTNAEIYDPDESTFDAAKSLWEAYPEYAEEDEDDEWEEIDDEDEHEDDDEDED